MKKILLKTVRLSIVILVFFLLTTTLTSCSRKPYEPFTIHIWELPNGDIIKYYEIWDGHSGFTADISKFLLWQQGRKQKKYEISSVGGSYYSIKLMIDTNKKAIWLKARRFDIAFGIGRKFEVIAALNLVNGTCLDSDRLDFDEKELTKDQLELKNILNNEQGILVKEGKTVGKEEKVIKIGAILPLTGPYSQSGQLAEEGIDMAIDELSKEDIKPKINVIYVDSQGDTDAKVLNLFIKVDKVDADFVLTGFGTSKILPMINKEKIITFTGTLLPGITEKSPFLFRNATSLDYETKFMSQYLSTNKNKPSVAIIYVNNEAGISAKEQFKKSYNDSGKITAEESYGPGDTDFRTQLSKIKETKPEYLYILSDYLSFFSYKEFGYIMRQARELGIKAKFIGTSTFEDRSGVKVAGEAAEGAIYSISAFNPDSSDPKLVQFQENYKKRYHRKAELYAALFYDNVRILSSAYQSNPRNAEELRKAILSLDRYEGVSGRTKFLENGDVEKPLTLKIIHDGKFMQLK